MSEPPVTEDLMREHGILNRVLLIYENMIDKINEGIKFDVSLVYKTTMLVREFVEDYHEVLEEQYIFAPLLKKGLHVELINELTRQHRLSKILTNKILALSKNPDDNFTIMSRIAKLLKLFIYMYRAHESREDTVVFNEFRKITSKKEMEELSEIFEETEQKKFPDGYEGILAKVMEVEKILGIHDLKSYSVEDRKIYCLISPKKSLIELNK